MYQFATALFAGIIATVLVSGGALMPAPAEAAKLSKTEKAVLDRATVACKAEAKARKFSWHWLKRRRYVQNCVVKTVAGEGIGIDIREIRKAVNMKVLRPQRPGEWGCDPEC